LHKIGRELAKCEVMVDGNKEGKEALYGLEEVTNLD
jgi:hypothetical protein